MKNTSQAEFDFTSLLHTYFSVTNINSLSVTGLGGSAGFDQLTSSPVVAPNAIRFNENVDTIYREAENMIKIESDGGCVQLERKNMTGRLMVRTTTLLNNMLRRCRVEPVAEKGRGNVGF